MKEDVVAANLANLRQSINGLKECIEKQNTTVSKSEQSVKADFNEKATYTGIAKSFCTCWNEALSVVKKHIWQQQPNTLPFSLWFPKLIDLFKQKSKLLEYLYRHVCDYNQNRITIETNTRCILKRQDEILAKINELTSYNRYSSQYQWNVYTGASYKTPIYCGYCSYYFDVGCCCFC